MGSFHTMDSFYLVEHVLAIEEALQKCKDEGDYLTAAYIASRLHGIAEEAAKFSDSNNRELKTYRLALYPEEYSSGIAGPVISAYSLDEAQQIGMEMYPHSGVVAEEM